MTKLLKYLKSSTIPIIIIFGILIIQALCDLALPTYTSNIVNVGIQQGGIADTVPAVIRESEMERLLLFVAAEDQEVVLDSYTKLEEENFSKEEWKKYKEDYPAIHGERIYEKKEAGEAETEALQEILAKPMLIVSGFKSDRDEVKGLKEQMAAGTPEGTDIEEVDIFQIFAAMPEEQLTQVREEIEAQFSEMPDTIIEQAAVSYIKSEYEEIGIKTDKIQNSYIFTTGAKMLLVALISMAASILVGFMAAHTAAKVSRDLRSNVFKKVISFSNTEFDKFSTASLITRSTNDVQQVQMLIVMLLRMVLYAPILGIGGVIKIFDTNTSMAWIIGVAVGIIMIVVVILFAVVMPRFKALQKLVDRLNLVTREILTGLSVIRAFSKERYEEKRFEKANKDLMKTNLFVNRVMNCMFPFMILIMNVISVLIVWNGAHGINEGAMQVGDMMAFMQYTMQIIMSFLMICMVSIILPRASVSAVRLDEILSTETKIKSPSKPKLMETGKKGVVEFKNVSFRYPGADEDVLQDINFTAEPGKTTAIIGSTGSGKSTLINLIPRFYDVTGGQVIVDGQDVREVSQSDLRNTLGYVPQKGVLFSGTIASNIAYADPDIPAEQVEKAARIAQAEDFISKKSERYESHIAQGGGNVSGGQKQRLSIARAIAKKPEIYIFDDSFSALDYKTDVTLRQALKEETAESTVIIVAQRISTILHAEQIIVLDEGRIAGIGTHQELLKSSEVYKQIAMSQLSEEELAHDMNGGNETGKGEA